MIDTKNSRKNRNFVKRMLLNGKISLIRNRLTNSKITGKRKTDKEYP